MEYSGYKTWENIRYYGSLGKEALTDRIVGLDQEWDAEKFVKVSLSGLGVFGLVTGLVGSRLGRLILWITTPLLLLHAMGKWTPSQSTLRSAGFRSRREIDEEKYALKALRGDFKGLDSSSDGGDEGLSKLSSRALEAAKA